MGKESAYKNVFLIDPPGFVNQRKPVSGNLPKTIGGISGDVERF
jgi:hypothetical protein